MVTARGTGNKEKEHTGTKSRVMIIVLCRCKGMLNTQNAIIILVHLIY